MSPSVVVTVSRPSFASSCRCGGVRERRRVEREVGDALFFGEAVVVARVALVDGDQVALAAVLEGAMASGWYMPNTGQRRMSDDAVVVAHVELLLRLRVILEAEREDLLHATVADVDHGDRVVLLQRHPGGVAIGRDVLGLEVLGDVALGTIDADVGGQLTLPRARRH